MTVFIPPSTHTYTHTETATRVKRVLTILVHGCVETLVEAAGATLVTVGLVDGTLAFEVSCSLAGVHSVAVNTPLEEP